MFAIDVWLLGGNSSLSFGVDGVITWLLMVALNGYALGLLLTSQIHLSRVMCHTVRTLSFNLSQLADLQPASMPLVRLFAVISLFVSSWTFSVEIGGFPIAIYFFITPISLTVLFLYFLPVLLLRGRIKEKKEAALKKNLEMLAELDRQDEHEIIGHSAMLTQQMFIESRGEWPVAPHLQKLILFGLLPPLSWVMAAKIESLVS